MELKEFIATTIKDITDGITEADKYVREKDKNSYGIDRRHTPIAFDIAVTTNEEGKDKMGGKVSVVQFFSAGAETESLNKTSNSNRIQFTVFVHVNTSKVASGLY